MAAPTDTGDVDKPFPDPPPGTKWVGQERVVVAVPEDWPVTDLVCGTGAPYLVSSGAFAGARGCGALQPDQLAEVVFGRLGPGSPLSSRRGCLEDAAMTCFAVELLRDHGLYVNVSVTAEDARAQVDAILDSLMVLPDGWTTVPFVSNSVRDERVAALEAAGFDVTVREGDKIQGALMSFEPDLGSPIRTGGTITVSPAVPSEPTLDMVPLSRVVPPGEEVGLSFPTQMLRGIAFSLDAADGDGWRTDYYLIAAHGPGAEPTWSAAGEDAGWYDFGAAAGVPTGC